MPTTQLSVGYGLASCCLITAVVVVSQDTSWAAGAVTPLVDPAPPVVVDLGGGVAQVDWVDESPDEDGFDVQREEQKNNGSWFKTTIVATVPANTTSIADDAGTATFRYRVRAFNAGGESAWSGWTEITLADGGGEPPSETWIAWYVYPPEFTPLAPTVEDMAPELGCVIHGKSGPERIEHVSSNDFIAHFSQKGWGDFADGEHPCPSCPVCGAFVTPVDEFGDPTYVFDTHFAFNLAGDGTGNIEYRFLASGDPPGGPKLKRYHSVFVPVQDVVYDDPNDPNSAFTVIVRDPYLMLVPQTGPGDPMFVAIGDIRFEMWTP